MRPPGYVLWADEKSIDAVRFEDAVAAAPALEPPERAAALREALGLWRGTPLRRPRVRDVSAGRDRPARGAAARRARGAARGRAGARPLDGDPRRGDRARKPPPDARAPPLPADAVALPVGPPARGTARLPGHEARADRGAGARAGRGAARARANDHLARSRARGRERRDAGAGSTPGRGARDRARRRREARSSTRSTGLSPGTAALSESSSRTRQLRSSRATRTTSCERSALQPSCASCCRPACVRGWSSTGAPAMSTAFAELLHAADVENVLIGGDALALVPAAVDVVPARDRRLPRAPIRSRGRAVRAPLRAAPDRPNQ